MSKLFLTSPDFNKLEALNFRFQVLASDPGSPVSAWAYFNSTTKRLRVYDGVSAWVEMGAGGGTMTGATLTQPAAGLTVTNSGVNQTTAATWTISLADDLLALENLAANGIAARTGTSTWAVRTITGTTNQVAVTNGDGVAGNPTLSLPQNIHTAADVTFNSLTLGEAQTTATPGAHAARVDFVLGLVNGMKWKNSVRAATTAAGTLASSFANGSVIDGITLATGDRILIKDQAAPAENGIYTINASGAPTRAIDANSWVALVSAAVTVEVGTANADTAWNCNSDQGGTLGTTAVSFVQMPGALTVAAGNGLVKNGNALDVNVDGVTLQITGDALSVKNAGIDLTTKVTGILPVGNGGTGGNSVANAKTSLGFMTRFAQDIGDGSSTSISVTHNLGTLDVTVQIFRKSDGAQMECDVTLTNTNTVTLGFAVAPTSAQYRVVVVG
jgi:hypothetical protein